MKKVLATAAGLMLVGTMVSTAAAKIDLTGSARLRGYVERNYDAGLTNPRTNEIDDKIHTRFRVKIKASTESGVYGEAQIKLSEGTMDGGANTDNAITGDYGYLGVPLGPVTLEGGHKPIDATPFFFYDRSSDVVLLKYVNDMTLAQVFYIKAQEYAGTAADLIDDEDINIYAAYLNQKFGADMALTAFVWYLSDETNSDNSGFAGTIKFDAPNAGPVALTAEFAYTSEEVTAGPDAGFGGYVQGAMNFGAASVLVNVGATVDGYVADDDFGFIMIGGASSITPAVTEQVGAINGAAQDTVWGGATFGYKISDKMSVKGNLVYVDADIVTAFEASAKFTYVIVDGAKFTTDLGYLMLDADSFDTEDPFGAAFTLSVSF
ncbi:MAG: hypothetical protein D6B25_06555 [Desulfobulbaceae bacterium]|nr:MAG: hypothetical protein D6B25_06555 [Desulfobulbaceae bacterium]